MYYGSRKFKNRIFFVPDEEYERALEAKLAYLRRQHLVKILPINTFCGSGGLRPFLYRHHGDRFFVTIDLVHAFHQITRQMISEVYSDITGPHFDICFADEFGMEEVIPMGFATSNYLFEIFMTRAIDPKFVAWQKEHSGTITRYSDNILATWQKWSEDAFLDLQNIFAGLKIRITPQRPRKWRQPIRFCGAIIPKNGSPRLSRRRKERMQRKAHEKSYESERGVGQFIETWM